MPTRISGSPTRAFGLSAMKRRWQARAISVPMPAEVPGAAQATGLPPLSVFGSIPARSILRRSACSAIVPSKRPRAGSAPARAFISASTFRSMPPAKSALPEVMTMPLTAGSARAASTAASSSAMPSSVSTFIDLPGRSQVRVATPSASTSVAKIGISGLLGSGWTRRVSATTVPVGAEVGPARPVLPQMTSWSAIVDDVAPGFRVPTRQVGGVGGAAVSRQWRVRAAGLPGRCVAGAEQRLAVVLDQHELAFEQVDELVLGLVPVAQARARSRRQAFESCTPNWLTPRGSRGSGARAGRPRPGAVGGFGVQSGTLFAAADGSVPSR